MKRLVIDIDDVMCKGGFIYLVNEFLGTNYQEEDSPGYYIQDMIPQDRKNEWIDYYFNHNLYDHVNIMENAYKVIKKLYQKYEVYIASAYILHDSEEKSGIQCFWKYNWLYQQFPFISPERYIFIQNKLTIQADIRIDDKLVNLLGDDSQKLLYTAYHNRKITTAELSTKGVQRVDNWNQIEQILL